MLKFILPIIAAVGLAVTPATAATVAFESSGSFSNLVLCPGCTITGTGNNVLGMSGTPASTLTANTVSGSFDTPQSNVLLGSLTWVNNARAVPAGCSASTTA